MHQKFLSLMVALAFSIICAVVSFADIPPPPVNQIVGIPDTSFNNLVESDCRFCHEDPNIVDDVFIPDRHHLLIGTAVPSGTCAETLGSCERN